MSKSNSSYNQIIKSTSIFGGSQVINILIGVVRTKVVAILLGTVGVGLIGIYQSIVDMTRSVTGLGIDTSGVREIAQTADDETKLIRTTSIFKQWFFLSACVGLLACVAFCMPISIWAFDSPMYSMHIAALGFCVFLATLATGRSVIMQGLRKIGYMAKSGILASVIGLIVVVPLYYFFRMEAIIPSLIISSLVLYFCSDYYYRKLKIQTVRIDNKEAFEAGINTFKLGLFIVLGSVISTVSMFVVRTYVIRNLDLEAAGLFQSAWTITNVYLGVILRSMGTDFFPRLCNIVDDNAKTKALINEQTYVILAIASPIIVAMLVLSDFGLSMLYSSEFTLASDILRWQVVGTFLKVLAWPIAFILLAKNKGLLFLISEILFYVVYLVACYFLFPHFGLKATGIGYLIAYIIYLPTVFAMGLKLSDFVWTKSILLMILVNIILIGSAFYISEFQAQYTYLLGSVLFFITCIYAYFKLQKVFSISDLKEWFRKRK